MDLGLRDQMAVVTGASSGIGLEAARLLAAEGCTVVAAARRIDPLHALAEQAAARSETIVPMAVDLADQTSIQEFASNVIGRLKKINVLVNNAGFIQPAPLNQTSSEIWERTMAVNLTGVQQLYAALHGVMEPEVRIVNVSSLAGFSGAEKFAGFGAYTAAKSGLGGLTEVMAAELKPIKGRANALCPGAVDTPMLHSAAPGLKPAMTALDVARHIVFLASPVSFPLNGQNIALTGFA